MSLVRCAAAAVPVALAFSALVCPLRAQAGTAPAPQPSRVSVDVGAGAMRYGPHALVGLEFALPRRPLALRVDGLVGSAPVHEVPGRAFGVLGASLVLPLRAPDARLSPYVVGGAAASFSRHLSPEFQPVAGAGLRLRLGAVTPFVDVRTAPRGGVPVSAGLRF